jgi:hypothetical protein
VPLTEVKKSEKVAFVDHRRKSHIIVSVPGTYMLADHRNTRGERRSFPCRAVNVSPYAIAFSASVPLPLSSISANSKARSFACSMAAS